jgi:GMP synthase-like glutamine amidotransferase
VKRLLAIQHVKSEGLGIIGAGLEGMGLDADLVRVFKGERVPERINGYSALIVLGGPMGVYESDIYPFINKEIRLIRSALRERVPVLGICLGSQLLAGAAGAPVFKGNAKEIGWYDVTLTGHGEAERLFAGMPKTMTVFQWHGDTFDVPAGARNLATSRLFKNQLIKVGPNAYGIQFHLEVTEAMIKDWIRVNKTELQALKGAIDPDKILKDTPLYIDDLHRYGGTVIKRFLSMV